MHADWYLMSRTVRHTSVCDNKCDTASYAGFIRDLPDELSKLSPHQHPNTVKSLYVSLYITDGVFDVLRHIRQHLNVDDLFVCMRRFKDTPTQLSYPPLDAQPVTFRKLTLLLELDHDSSILSDDSITQLTVHLQYITATTKRLIFWLKGNEALSNAIHISGRIRGIVNHCSIVRPSILHQRHYIRIFPYRGLCFIQDRITYKSLLVM